MSRLFQFVSMLVGLIIGASASAQVVNVSANYGFTFDGGGSDPAPVPGQHINLIGSPPVTLTLGAGDYVISNAAGKPGALFSAWSYNIGTSSWAWAFVMADNSTRRVLGYYEAGGGSSATAVAALPAVQNFSAQFSLSQSTTLLFTLRDYYVPDNAGGISLYIAASPVPEPSIAVLFAAGMGVLMLRRRSRKGSAAFYEPSNRCDNNVGISRLPSATR